METIILKKNEWRFAYKQHDETKENGFAPLAIADFAGTETYPAVLSECFEYNLYRAGLAPEALRVMKNECLSYSLGAVEVLSAGLGENVGDYAALAVAKGDF